MTKIPSLNDLTPEQKDALIIELVTRLDALETKLEKDSHNSSKPPSTDGMKRKPKSLREPGMNPPGSQQRNPDLGAGSHRARPIAGDFAFMLFSAGIDTMSAWASRTWWRSSSSRRQQ
ncbi:DUF6444 domain-containing protein [Cupriavidus sp. M-11]|uniref:DUF6444 domain-containing protein n=1 Tax=Cupriavidus sp. M-11 TaxID=3233038 RepID=UPI003F906094